MIGYIVFGLLFVLLIVFTILTVRNWHWSNIVVLVLTYLAGVGAIYGAGQVAALRNRDVLAARQSGEKLAKVTAELRAARYGGGDSVTYSPQSLYGVEEALKLKLMGRGRVWMNGQVSAVDANRKFAFPVARNAGEAQIGALNDVLVYAFLDVDIEGTPYPGRFIGTFRVSAESASDVLLTPELILNDQYYQAQGTWTLFEKMPSDQHDLFSLARENGDGQMTISEFREKLVTQYLTPEATGMDPASAEYELLIDQIAFDGRPIGEIETWIEENAASRKAQRFSPKPEEVFVRYKFNKKSNRSYKVDGQGNLESDGPYTLLGEAIDPALHLESEVQFNPDDEVLIDLPTASGYQRADQTAILPFSQQEDVTEVNRIFRRTLINFPAMFADLRRQAIDLGLRAEYVRKQDEVQAQTLEDTNAQIAKRDDIKLKMQQDVDNLQKDVDVISALLKQRTEELDNMQQEIADLERKISAQRARRDSQPVPNS